jgi:hypothetical protein
MFELLFTFLFNIAFAPPLASGNPCKHSSQQLSIILVQTGPIPQLDILVPLGSPLAIATVIDEDWKLC